MCGCEKRRRVWKKRMRDERERLLCTRTPCMQVHPGQRPRSHSHALPLSNPQCGTLGSVNTFAGIAGGLIAGRVTDWPILNRRLKTLVIACALMAGVFFFLFALALPPYKAPALAHWSFATFLTMCGLAGLFRGATDPLFFELSAELTHPRPAGISGSVLTFFYHLLLVASLSVPSHILNKWTTTIMYSSMALCALLLLPIRPRYVRRLET